MVCIQLEDSLLNQEQAWLVLSLVRVCVLRTKTLIFFDNANKFTQQAIKLYAENKTECRQLKLLVALSNILMLLMLQTMLLVNTVMYVH